MYSGNLSCKSLYVRHARMPESGPLLPTTVATPTELETLTPINPSSSPAYSVVPGHEEAKPDNTKVGPGGYILMSARAAGI